MAVLTLTYYSLSSCSLYSIKCQLGEIFNEFDKLQVTRQTFPSCN